MNRRIAVRCAWLLFGAYLLCVVTAVVFGVVGGNPLGTTAVVLGFGFATVGVLVAAREPVNPVGWLLLVAAIAYGFPAGAYTWSSELPGAAITAWVSSWLFFVWLGAVGLLLPLSDASDRALHQGESADLLSQPPEVSHGDGLIAIIAPQTNAPLARGGLKSQHFRHAWRGVGSRIHQGKPVFEKPMGKIEVGGLPCKGDPDREAVPAVALGLCVHQNVAGGLAAQPSQGRLASGRRLGKPQSGEPRQASGAQHQFPVPRDGLDPGGLRGFGAGGTPGGLGESLEGDAGEKEGGKQTAHG